MVNNYYWVIKNEKQEIKLYKSKYLNIFTYNYFYYKLNNIIIIDVELLLTTPFLCIYSKFITIKGYKINSS